MNKLKNADFSLQGRGAWGPFLESPGNFSGPKSFRGFRETGPWFVNQESVQLQTELDNMMSSYQLIITITISHKS